MNEAANSAKSFALPITVNKLHKKTLVFCLLQRTCFHGKPSDEAHKESLFVHLTDEVGWSAHHVHERRNVLGNTYTQPQSLPVYPPPPPNFFPKLLSFEKQMELLEMVEKSSCFEGTPGETSLEPVIHRAVMELL